MSVEIQSPDGSKKMLKFKQTVTLEQFGKCLGAYNLLYKTFAGRDATYQEFTAYLQQMEWVE
jgi:hypothetical protein